MRLTLEQALAETFICYNCIYWDIDTRLCTVDNTERDEEDDTCDEFEPRDFA